MSDFIRYPFGLLVDAPNVDVFDYFIGIKNTGGDTYVNYKYTFNDLAAAVFLYFTVNITALTSNISTTTNTDDTLEDSWFNGKTIEEIATNNQIYLKDTDFTQIGNKIKLLNATWADTQKLRARL